MSAVTNKGGKKKRRGKNLNLEARKIEFPTEDQYYGEVVKVLGSGKFEINYFTENSKENQNIGGKFACNKILGSIRGNMKRRIYVNKGDIVIISLRDFQKNVGDIIHKYLNTEISYLYRKNLIPTSINLNEDDIGFYNDAELDNTQNKKETGNYTGFTNNDLIPDFDTEEEEENINS